MPIRKQVNLLPKDEFEYTTLGKLVKWCVNVGRWIVVITEFVVICAFLSRFYFDTELANLFDDLNQKQAIVDSAISFEENFRTIQTKTSQIKEILAKEKKPSVFLAEVSQTMPINMYLSNISIEGESLKLEGNCLSENELKTFLSSMIKNSKLEKINLSGLSSQKEGLPGIKFTISAAIKK